MKTKPKEKLFSRRIECACGHDTTVVARNATDLAITLNALGWAQFGQRHVCPACVKK